MTPLEQSNGRPRLRNAGLVTVAAGAVLCLMEMLLALLRSVAVSPWLHHVVMAGPVVAFAGTVLLTLSRRDES